MRSRYYGMMIRDVNDQANVDVEENAGDEVLVAVRASDSVLHPDLLLRDLKSRVSVEPVQLFQVAKWAPPQQQHC